MPKLSYELTVYPFHIDLMGHVNNTIYIQWMEIGRTLLIDAVGMPMTKIMQQGFGPVLVDTQISYKKPLLLGDTVATSIWVSKLRGASAEMSFEFCNQHGDLAAKGVQRGLFVNLSNQKPKRLSSEDRDRFIPYLIEPVAEA